MTVRVIGGAGIDTASQTLIITVARPVPLGLTQNAETAYIGSPNTATPRAITASSAVALQPTVILQQTTYYKLRGWDPLLLAFETWVSTNQESSAPSGHTLVGREISAKWSV